MEMDKATLQAAFDQAAFMRHLGVEAEAGETGSVTARLRVRPEHRQQTGVVHAGVIASLADHTSGAAAYTVAPPGQHVVTAEIKLSLLRGAAGAQLRAVARVVKPGRQLVFTECEVFDQAEGGEARLVAKSSATMVLVPG